MNRVFQFIRREIRRTAERDQFGFTGGYLANEDWQLVCYREGYGMNAVEVPVQQVARCDLQSTDIDWACRNSTMCA